MNIDAVNIDGIDIVKVEDQFTIITRDMKHGPFSAREMSKALEMLRGDIHE